MASSEVSQESQDISRIPTLSFEDVVKYAEKQSGCKSTAKACKFMAEPGYLHDIKVVYSAVSAKVSCKCYRSMKKSEPPHKLEFSTNFTDASQLAGRCSCVAGAGGFCHHVIGLMYYISLLKQLGHKSLPDELTCTMMKQRWSVPRGKKIEPKQIQDVLVKKPQMGAAYNKYIKSTLYSPAQMYGTLTKEHFGLLDPKPLFSTLVPSQAGLRNVTFVPCKYGNVPKGCALSYQQKLSSDYVINDFSCTAFPTLPLETSELRFQNNYQPSLLDTNQQALLDSLAVTREMSIKVQEQTVTQSSSSMWHLLRKKRITASKFGKAAKRTGNFETFVSQLNPTWHRLTDPMKRGIELEPHAAMIYASKAKDGKVNLFPSGLVINPKCPWLGCSPDRKVYELDSLRNDQNPFGLLEIKVVKEGETSFDNVRYLTKDTDTGNYKLKHNDDYYYQVQCQLGLTGLEWCDFFSYINDDLFVCDRIVFDSEFFQNAKDKVDNFFFNYYLS